MKVRVGSIAGTAAAAAVASVSSPAAAHVDPSAAARYRDSSRLSKPSPGPHYIDEDYDLCTEDFGTGRDLSSQLGGVPSQEEADEATRELRATFVQKYDPAPISVLVIITVLIPVQLMMFFSQRICIVT